VVTLTLLSVMIIYPVILQQQQIVADLVELEDEPDAQVAMHEALFAFGTQGDGDGQMNGPKGIGINRTGYIYVADTENHRIQVFSPNGSYLFQWGEYGDGVGEFNRPTALAINHSGYIYVVDSLNNRIQTFTHNGTFLRAWGSLGVEDGNFYNPQGIGINVTGGVYISDTLNHRIQVFDAVGTHLQTWGDYYYSNATGDFNSPVGIAINDTGHVYITDTLNNRIQVFNMTGDFISTWGSLGDEPGQFYQPSGITINRTGQIYVADTFNHRVQVFSINGTFLHEFGQEGPDLDEFRYPYQLAINHTNHIYVADSDNHRIQVFQHPEQPTYWSLDFLIITEEFLADPENYLYVYGQGTEEYPYVIKNLEFIGDGTYPLITIINVTSYLHLYDLILTNGSIGINATNSRNLEFSSILSRSHAQNAVHLANCSQVTLEDSEMTSIGHTIFSATTGEDLLLQHCNFTHTLAGDANGLTLTNITTITLYNLSIDEIGHDGLWMSNVNHTEIDLTNFTNIAGSGVIGEIIHNCSINTSRFISITGHGVWLNQTELFMNASRFYDIGETATFLTNAANSTISYSNFTDAGMMLNISQMQNLDLSSSWWDEATYGVDLYNLTDATISGCNISNINGLIGNGITGNNWINVDLSTVLLQNVSGYGYNIDNWSTGTGEDLLINNTMGEGLVINQSTNLMLSHITIINGTALGLYAGEAINLTFSDIAIYNFTGVDQEAGSDLIGGQMVGLFLDTATNVTGTTGIISRMFAGNGAVGDGSDGNGDGWDGGLGAGIILRNVSHAQISSWAISNITGGIGGATGSQNASAGNGGLAVGILVDGGSWNNSITDNDIQDIIGGNGGSASWSVDSGGAGGDSVGIYLDHTFNNTFSDNIFEHLNVSSGAGSTYRGNDGNIFGFYFADNSTFNNVVDITNKIHSEYPYYSTYRWYYTPIYYFFNQSDITVASKTFYATNPTNLGAIVAINCTNVIISGNNIRGVSGKKGKTGKTNETGDPGENGIGILIINGSTITVQSNTIWSIFGGTGGLGGYGGNGTAGGQGIGVMLERCNNTIIYYNNYYVDGGNGGKAGYSGDLGGDGGNSQAVLAINSINLTMQNRHNHIAFSAGAAGSVTSGSAGEKFVLRLVNTNNTKSSFSQTFDHSDSYSGAVTAMVSPVGNSQNNIWSSQHSPEVQSTFNQTITFAHTNDPIANTSTLFLHYRINSGEWVTLNVSGTTSYAFNESIYAHEDVVTWYLDYNQTTNDTITLYTLSFELDDDAPDILYFGSSGYDVFLKERTAIDFDFIEANSLYSAKYKWGEDGTYRTSWTNGTVFVSASDLKDGSGQYTLYYSIRDLAGNWNSTTLNFTLDVEDPVISLESPVDYYDIYDDFLVNLTVSDNLNLSTVQYNWDNTSWNDLESPFDIDVVNISEGTHILFVRAYDLANNLEEAEYEFIIDQTAPTLAISTAQNRQYASRPRIYYTSGDTYTIDALEYQIDNASGWYTVFDNFASNETQSNFYIDSALFTSLSNTEQHIVYFRVTDDVGNERNFTTSGATPTFSFWKDVSTPWYEIHTTNDTYWNSAPDLNITFSDNLRAYRAYYKVDTYSPTGGNLDDWILIYSGNTQPTYNAEFTVNGEIWDELTQGQHSVWFKAFDGAGIVNASTTTYFSFWKDDVVPSFLCNYTNNSVFGITPPTLNFTFADTIELESVYYKINSYSPLGTDYTGWTALHTGLSNSSANSSIPFAQEDWLAMPQGYHQVYFKITDHIGNIFEGPSACFQFFKDTAPPNATFNDPDYSYYNSVPILDIDIVDSTGLDSAYYRIDEFNGGYNITGWNPIVENHTSESYTANFQFNTTLWNNLTEGQHILYIKGWDDLGNYIQFSDYNWTFYKDLTAPTYVIDSNTLVNYTVYSEPPKIYTKFNDRVGNNPGNLSAAYYKFDSPLPAGENLLGWHEIFSDVDYYTNEAGFFIDTDVWYGLEDGIHTLYIKLFDDAGNYDDQCTQSFIFEKDATGPAISLINGTGYYSTIDSFWVNISIDTLDAVGAQYKWNEAVEYSNFTTDFLAIAASLPDGVNWLYVKAWDNVSNPIFPSIIQTGNINIQYYPFIVDNGAPYFTLVTPNGTIYNDVPTFNITFTDDFALDSGYYVINTYTQNGTTTQGWIELFTDSSLASTNVQISLNASQWAALSEGENYVYFKAWDDLNNLNDSDAFCFMFIKDITVPTYVLNISQDLFFADPPTVNLTCYDTYGVGSLSYQIDDLDWTVLFTDGTDPVNFTSFTIPTNVWNGLADGEHSIAFIVSDYVGNINNSLVLNLTLTKDTTCPDIAVLSDQDLYYNFPPPFIVEFTDVYSLDQAYYKVNITGEWYPIFLTHPDATNQSTVILNATLWNLLEEGNHTIFFRVLDDLGNENITELVFWTFNRDITLPYFTINMINGTYYNAAPTLDVNFGDFYTLNASYYKVDSYSPAGTDTTDWIQIFSEQAGTSYTTNFTLDATVWTNLAQGTHTVYFKVWDDATNLNGTHTIAWQFYKDTYDPNITINTDQGLNFKDTPTIDIDFDDTFTLHSAYYQFDSSSPAGTDTTGWSVIFADSSSETFTDDFEIDNAIWEALSDGEHTLYIKVWDDAGNNEDSFIITLEIHKDTTAPTITITPPDDNNYNDIFYMDVDFSDTYSLQNAYYKVDSYESGLITNTTGWILIFLNSDANTNTTDFLMDQSVWDGLGEGTHYVYFKCWDDWGNINNGSTPALTILKDVHLPYFMINSLNGTYYNTAPELDIDFFDSYSLNGSYYKVDSYSPAGTDTTGWIQIFLEQSGTSYITNFTIDGTVWANLAQGTHTVYFKVWDDADNLNSTHLVAWQFYKDTYQANITCNTDQGLNFRDAPTIDVDFDDTYNLSAAYYKFDSSSPAGSDTTGWTAIFTSSDSDSYTDDLIINSGIWEALSDGEHTIYFKVFDDAGNINDDYSVTLTIHKDTTAPTITVNEPTDNHYNETFYIDVDFSDAYSLNYSYYRVDSDANGEIDDLAGWTIIFNSSDASSNSTDFLLDEIHLGWIGSGISYHLFPLLGRLAKSQ
jgi:hypothetical protein